MQAGEKDLYLYEVSDATVLVFISTQLFSHLPVKPWRTSYRYTSYHHATADNIIIYIGVLLPACIIIIMMCLQINDVPGPNINSSSPHCMCSVPMHKGGVNYNRHRLCNTLYLYRLLLIRRLVLMLTNGTTLSGTATTWDCSTNLTTGKNCGSSTGSTLWT